MFRFKIIHQDKKTNARVGEIRIPHGVIKTPAFVPVGTQATVKSVTPEELETLGTQVFFVNTYHMYLRPGIAVVEKLGGLHTFMGWDGPIITDSGGFQVFSLGRNKEATPPHPLFRKEGEGGSYSGALVTFLEDGVEFRSHWDGSKHTFTPESAMEWQWRMGGDIHIAFDDCTSYPVTHEKAKQSMERTHRWAKRSLKEHKRLDSRLRGNDKRGSGNVTRGEAGMTKSVYIRRCMALFRGVCMRI